MQLIVMSKEVMPDMKDNETANKKKNVPRMSRPTRVGKGLHYVDAGAPHESSCAKRRGKPNAEEVRKGSAEHGGDTQRYLLSGG